VLSGVSCSLSNSILDFLRFFGVVKVQIIRKILTQHTVLEIGTFIGFSTMGWAHAVGPAGHVTALEFSPEYASLAEENFAKNDIKNIQVLVGDAKDSYVVACPIFMTLHFQPIM
jgi:protein-L-isoaspartate O-methyltransferase